MRTLGAFRLFLSTSAKKPRMRDARLNAKIKFLSTKSNQRGDDMLKHNIVERSSSLVVAQLHKLQAPNSEEPLVIVDVRTPSEYAENHIPGAINIPLEELLSNDKLLSAPSDANIVAVCNRGGERSKKAASRLYELGWSKASALTGGMAGWKPSLNQLLKTRKFEEIQEHISSGELDSTEFDDYTLNIGLLTGEASTICALVEKGAKANEESVVCAAIGAPIFITVVLSMLKAQGLDLNTQLNAKYGLTKTEPLQKTQAPPELVTQRIRKLEVDQFWKTVWISRQNRGEDPNFHDYKVKPYLAEYLSKFSKEKLNTILVPFCGKSIDMLWLQQQGYNVIGVDLSDEATDAFFAQNNLSFEKTQEDDFFVKRAKTSTGSLTILCGDIFKLQPKYLQNVHLVFDRAGYNSIPPELRQQYAALLIQNLPKITKMLLGVLDFDGQEPKSCPPYFISEQELTENFKGLLDIHVHAEKRQDYFPPSLVANAPSLIWSAVAFGSSIKSSKPKQEHQTQEKERRLVGPKKLF